MALEKKVAPGKAMAYAVDPGLHNSVDMGLNVFWAGLASIEPTFGRQADPPDPPATSADELIAERNRKVDLYWSNRLSISKKLAGFELNTLNIRKHLCSGPAFFKELREVGLFPYAQYCFTPEMFYVEICTIFAIREVSDYLIEMLNGNRDHPRLHNILAPSPLTTLYHQYWTNKDEPTFKPDDPGTWGAFVPSEEFRKHWDRDDNWQDLVDTTTIAKWNTVELQGEPPE